MEKEAKERNQNMVEKRGGGERENKTKGREGEGKGREG